MIETKESRAKWLKEHEAAKAAFRAMPLGRRPVKGISDGSSQEPIGSSQTKHGRYKDGSARRAYRREWMKKKRQKTLDTPKGV